jgi:hypothetical protein
MVNGGFRIGLSGIGLVLWVRTLISSTVQSDQELVMKTQLGRYMYIEFDKNPTVIPSWWFCLIGGYVACIWEGVFLNGMFEGMYACIPAQMSCFRTVGSANFSFIEESCSTFVYWVSSLVITSQKGLEKPLFEVL